MKLFRREFLSALCGAAFAGRANAAERANGDEPDQERQRLITISKETTYITEPIRKDGYVDYVAALNAKLSDGVTRENNAIIPLLQAMGMDDADEKERQAVAKKLGLELRTGASDHYVPFITFAKEQVPNRPAVEKKNEEPVGDPPDPIFELYDRIIDRPWKAEEVPIAADWLKKNEKYFAFILDATNRPRMWYPQPDGESLVEFFATHHVTVMREAARALLARSMFYLGSGRVEGAWQDALAIQRLARLTAQGPFLVDALVAVAISGVAGASCRAVIQHERLSAKQAKTFRAELAALSPAATLADVMAFGERLYALDAVCLYARRGSIESANWLDPAAIDYKQIVQNFFIRLGLVDWDAILRRMNDHFDAIEEVLRQPADREAAIVKRLEEAEQQLKLGLSLGRSFGRGTSLKGEVTNHLSAHLIGLLGPSVQASTQAETRSNVELSLVLTGLSLAEYRADHGVHPNSLDRLVPKYVAEKPHDLFTGDPLTYLPEGDGYLLYSFGADKTDNQGRGYDEGADDLSFRMPALKPNAK